VGHRARQRRRYPHISCDAHYTLFIPYIAQEILTRLGKSHVVFGGRESCCGLRQMNTGYPDLEQQNAKLAQLSCSRVRLQLLVSVCPDCDEVFEKFRLPTTRASGACWKRTRPALVRELTPSAARASSPLRRRAS
jgi:heterodisulfide reductase subunit B